MQTQRERENLHTERPQAQILNQISTSVVKLFSSFTLQMTSQLTVKYCFLNGGGSCLSQHEQNNV